MDLLRGLSLSKFPFVLAGHRAPCASETCMEDSCLGIVEWKAEPLEMAKRPTRPHPENSRRGWYSHPKPKSARGQPRLFKSSSVQVRGKPLEQPFPFLLAAIDPFAEMPQLLSLPRVGERARRGLRSHLAPRQQLLYSHHFLSVFFIFVSLFFNGCPCSWVLPHHTDSGNDQG